MANYNFYEYLLIVAITVNDKYKLKIIYQNIILFYLLKLSLITKIMNYSILSI